MATPANILKNTFVSKCHNAVKLTENMAREMFLSGVRIIVRPSGRNSLERGVMYKRGDNLCYNPTQTADSFDQVIKDFAVGFGDAEGNNNFRFYLYID